MSEVWLVGRRAAAAQPDQPRPGFRCRDCGTKMRSPGTYIVYLIVLLIALSVLVGTAYAAVELGCADRPVWMLWFGGVGLIVAGYAAMQLSRPAPLPRRAVDEAEGSGYQDAGQ